MATTRLRLARIDIRDRIRKGHELRPEYYRINRDSSVDDLLEREGIMHLHLSARDRDATLFLVQYPDRVVLPGVSNHSAFREYPPGSTLARLHAQALDRIEVEVVPETAKREAEVKIAVRSGIRPRRDKPA